jgi:N-carbamoyl-L-amino-acid hydrolase
MPWRRDAFLAAAEIALLVETAARSTGAQDTVGTTGICDIFPRAVNSIPSRARMEIDVRDIDGPRRDSVLGVIQEGAVKIAGNRNVSLTQEVLNADPPATCDSGVIAVLDEACQTHGLTREFLISRAYHDSLFMSLIAPTSMIFIPCRGGVSHRPDEYSSPEAIARGTLVLAETLGHLARR